MDPESDSTDWSSGRSSPYNFAEAAARSEGERLRRQVNVEVLRENLLGVRQAIRNFLDTKEARSVTELQLYLAMLDATLVEQPVDGGRDGFTESFVTPERHQHDDEHQRSTSDVLSSIRASMEGLVSARGPLPLAEHLTSQFHVATDNEIVGIDMRCIRKVLFQDGPATLVTDRGNDIPSAEPSSRRYAFYVVTRGSKFGIFNDSSTVQRLIDRVPRGERRGCSSYSDALRIFVQAWLRGDVGIFVPPG